MRLRLQSPARRRISSAEWPGPGTVMSALDRPRQHALQPPLQPLHGSHLHQGLQRQHEIQRYRRRKAAQDAAQRLVHGTACAWHNCTTVYLSQPAADSPKVSGQVLADEARHLEHVQAFRRALHSQMLSWLITSSRLVLARIVPRAQLDRYWRRNNRTL